MERNALDQEWSGGSLLRFAFPTVAMMIFMGLYTVVDTVFVSRFVNTDALSAVNIVCPVINVTVGLGTMLAAGGNAVVSRKMGAGRMEEAREDFTLLIRTGAAAGLLILLAGTVWINEIIRALGASARLFPYCKEYLMTLLLFLPANVLQTLFSNLFVTAGKPGLGLGLSLLAGMANILLDYLFIVPCALGIRGAALGTGIGYLIPTVAGLLYFSGNRGTLTFTRLTRSGLRWEVVGESCFNGSSELVSQLASAVVTFLFNRAMMDLRGEDGVAAITILLYTQFLLHTMYIGFSMGVAPVIGFHFGSGDHFRQRRILSICLQYVGGVSVLVFFLSRLGGPWIVGLFAKGEPEAYRIAAEGFSIFSYGFLFCGLNIFTSAMFTALSKGKLSAALSFFRTFVLLAGGILLLPRAWGILGIWLAVPIAEGVMFIVSTLCLTCYINEMLRTEMGE